MSDGVRQATRCSQPLAHTDSFLKLFVVGDIGDKQYGATGAKRIWRYLLITNTKPLTPGMQFVAVMRLAVGDECAELKAKLRLEHFRDRLTLHLRWDYS